MAKYNIYAVAIGVNPETKEIVTNAKFKTWDECKPYVIGSHAHGVKYKGFLTESEADAWLSVNSNGSSSPSVLTKDEEDLFKTPVTKQSNDSVKDDVDERFKEICLELKISEDKVLKHIKELFIVQYDFMKLKKSSKQMLDFNKR